MYNPYLGSSSDDSIIFVIMILYFSIFAIMFAVGITGYILKGLGLYRMGQRRNISYAWLAWIPIASNFLFGKLAGFREPQNKKYRPVDALISINCFRYLYRVFCCPLYHNTICRHHIAPNGFSFCNWRNISALHDIYFSTFHY